MTQPGGRAQDRAQSERQGGVTRTAYHVALPVFQGPLDLLLHLIEREELDITEVSLAQVTNQYLDYLAHVEERSPDQLADFMVVAARLILIKSRVLLPGPPRTPEAGDAEDADDLVQQLIAYKRFKEAAGWLQELGDQGQHSYVRLPGVPPVDPVVDLGDVTLDDLLRAVRDALALQPPTRSVDRAVPPVTITIADQMALIERRAAAGRPVSFRRLIECATSRIEVIVTLLALLELVKQLRVTMRQDRSFGDILIAHRQPAA
jgi:segregation and condensation protein A